MRILLARLASLVSHRRLDAELTEELETHRSMVADDLVRRGATSDEARRRAAVTVGNTASLVQEHRERRWWAPASGLGRDARFAFRQLRRRPGFMLAAVLTMALGTGVNTTVFSALNAVALRRLPIDRGDRAIRVERWFDSQRRGTSQFLYSEPEYRFLLEHLDTVSDLVAVSGPINVHVLSVPELAAGGPSGEAPFVAELVSDNFFTELGVRARIGRVPTPDELRTPGSAAVLFLSDAGWRARFNADPAIVGRVVTLNGAPFTVVGVGDPSFIGTGNPPEPPDFWAPIGLKTALTSGVDWVGAPAFRVLQLLGHVPPAIALGAASTRTGAVASRLAQEFPSEDATIALTLEPATFFGETNDPRFALFVGLLAFLVGVVLLAACANLANMLLAAGAGRTREIALRLSLGAGRGRIVRHLLVESVLLAWMGAAVALVASLWSTHLLWVRIAGAVQTVTGGRGAFMIDLSPDWRVFLFTTALATAAGILFGLAPARQLARTDLVAHVKDGGAQIQGTRRSRLRAVLVAGQVAVSMTLAVVAGLLARGALRADSANAGFDTRHVYSIGYASDPDPARALADEQAIFQALSRSAAIEHVARVLNLPFTGTWTRPVYADQPAGSTTTTIALLNVVSPSYFNTIGVRLVRGRMFTDDEATSGAAVAIVSAQAAHTMWPAVDPIGREVRFAIGPRRDSPLSAFTVVGVVEDARTANISRVDPAVVYRPTNAREVWNLMMRSARDRRAVVSAVHAAVAAVNPRLTRTLSVDDLESRFVATQRVLPATVDTIALALAMVALALAVAGVHGVVAFLASQRVNEVAIRLALGATRRDILRLVLGQGTAPVAFGMGIGLACAVAVSTVLHQFVAIAPGSPDYLFGVGAFDPLTYAGVAAIVGSASWLAAAGPAWRTARVDPIVTLKQAT